MLCSGQPMLPLNFMAARSLSQSLQKPPFHVSCFLLRAFIPYRTASKYMQIGGELDLLIASLCFSSWDNVGIPYGYDHQNRESNGK